MPEPDSATPDVQPGIRRCPMCGQLITGPIDLCPRCNPPREHQDVINDDTTAFALAPRRDRKARWAMCKWVYAAGSERLNHLARMRASAASRQFARRHLGLLAVAAALVQVSHIGWHRVIRTVDNATFLITEPAGRAWLKVAEAELSPRSLGLAALWWNPVRGLLSFVAGLVSGFVLACLVMLVLRAGAMVALSPGARAEGRLGSAIHYGTAWARPIYYTAWVLLLAPFWDILKLLGWPLTPPALSVYVIASVVAGSAALMWWFWLIRLATTLPQDLRLRVIVHYAFVAPVLIAALVAGWRIGLDRLYDYVWPELNLTW